MGALRYTVLLYLGQQVRGEQPAHRAAERRRAHRQPPRERAARRAERRHPRARVHATAVRLVCQDPVVIRA